MRTDGYDPESIYSRIYDKTFDLRGSGYPKLSLSFNTWLYRTFLRSLKGLLKDHKIVIKGARVLEFASGSGFYTHYFSTLEPAALTGLDITAKSVEVLSRKFNSYTFMQADITDPGLDPPGGPFDFGSAFNMVYHILDDQKFTQAIVNLGRCLKSGGWALVNDPMPPKSTEPRGHVRFRSREMFEHAFDQAELDLMEVRLIQFWGAEPVGDPESLEVKKAARLWSRLSRQARKSELRGHLAGLIFYLMNYPRETQDLYSLPFNKFILGRKP